MCATGNSTRGDELEVDLFAGSIKNLTTGKQYSFPPFPSFLQKIIEAGGLMQAMAGGGSGMKYNIALVPGDGIGPEITEAAVAVLNAVGKNSAMSSGLNPFLPGATPSINLASAAR